MKAIDQKQSQNFRIKLSVNKQIILAAMGMFVIASEASARRSNRDGFNFGTTVRFMDADDRSEPTAINDKSSRTQSQSTAFSPYFGYSFGEINIGLAGLVENRKDNVNESNKTGTETVTRDVYTNTKGLSLFGRFNFGKIMFLEAGAGAYSQTTDVHNEYRIANSDGTFSGKVEDYKVAGIGPGYHVGGGFELPINNGFFFTGSYLVRAYNLRDQSSSEFGDKIGNQQKRELSFGISYYN